MSIEVKNMTTRSLIARQLLQIKAIKLSPQKPFTWASGIQSPIYCDNRICLSYPEVRQQIIKGFIEATSSFSTFQTVAGVATAGIAYGALVAEAMQLPFVYVRSKAKQHGRQNQIEGQLTGHENVLVVEDLISTGGSSLRAVEALRQTGCNVVGVIAIFSYGLEQARSAFAKAECPLYTLTDYETLIGEAASSGQIDNNQQAMLQSWKSDPTAWISKITT